MKNKKIHYWVCDKSENSGEGQLALFYLKSLKKKFRLIEIKKPKIRNRLLNKIINYKYILPFLGVLYCWKFFFYKKKIYYINYLPLWNFILFLFLPPNSNIGPITGGANFSKNSSFVRKFLFPIFYKISEIIIIIRKFNLIFSTDLLKKYLYKKTIKKSIFNFIVNNFEFKKKKVRNKNIDFLIYYRNHPNKKKLFPFHLIKNLIELGFKINIVGNKLNNSNIKNHGFLKRKKLIKLQRRAKYTIFSEENLYSIFTLECIENNVLVLIDKSNDSKLTFFKKRFIKINYQNLKELRKLNYLYKNR